MTNKPDTLLGYELRVDVRLSLPSRLVVLRSESFIENEVIKPSLGGLCGKTFVPVLRPCSATFAQRLASCAMPCTTPLHLRRRRCALSMGLENGKLDGFSMEGWCGGARCVVGSL